MMVKFSAALLLAACSMDPAPAPGAGTCDTMHAVLFVREFVAGVEQGCDPGLVGSTSAGEEVERVPCVPAKPGSSPYGPYGIGANAFTWENAGDMEENVTFHGFAGSSTLVFSEEECASGNAWRSVSIYK